MNYQEFFDSLKQGDIRSAYVFEGEEEYIKAQAVKQLCGKLLLPGLELMNLTELNHPAVDEVIAAAETLPMMADRRLVLVREFGPLSGKAGDDEDTERILRYLPGASPSACLVFLVKGKADGRRKLYGFLKQNHTVVDFSPMTEPQAVSWILRSMKALGKRMDTAVAERFLFTVGNDAALLKQEMEKLADYAGERAEVTQADINAVSVKSLECTVFQMVDAQVAGEYGEALGLMQGVLDGGEDRMLVLSMLLRQYRMLYQLRCLMAERVPQSEFPSLLKIPPFAARRMQAQAVRYDQARLKAVYDFLLDFEYRIKSGKLPQDGCAEAALMQMKQLLEG